LLAAETPANFRTKSGFRRDAADAARMSRRKRVIIPGLPYHVTHRGNHREAILSTSEQRAMYVRIMLRWQAKTGVTVAAFVIMPNHVHFIVVVPTPQALARWIGNGHREYSKWLNTVRETNGHNWEERYYAVVMDPEHCLNALRYIEQNPVAAGLARHPWEWHWSSAAHHCGFGGKPALLNGDLRPDGISSEQWKAALLTESAESFRRRLHECSGRGIALADPAWATAMEALHGVRLLPGKPGRPRTGRPRLEPSESSG
jgi:putative transposase